MTQWEIETLSEADCWSLLNSQAVGRFVFSDEHGVGAIPLNFALGKDEIVFRVAADSHLRNVLAGPVALQVDDLTPDNGASWSVLVRGTVREVPLSEMPGLIGRLENVPQPLAEGVHNTWLSLTPSLVTGRRMTEPVLATALVI